MFLLYKSFKVSGFNEKYKKYKITLAELLYINLYNILNSKNSKSIGVIKKLSSKY